MHSLICQLKTNLYLYGHTSVYNAHTDSAFHEWLPPSSYIVCLLTLSERGQKYWEKGINFAQLPSIVFVMGWGGFCVLTELFSLHFLAVSHRTQWELPLCSTKNKIGNWPLDDHFDSGLQENCRGSKHIYNYGNTEFTRDKSRRSQFQENYPY